MKKSLAVLLLLLLVVGCGKSEEDPEVQRREAAYIELEKRMTFGTAEEKAAGAQLVNAITIAKNRGLDAVRPDLQRSVIPWLEPLFGEKEADRILGR